MAETIINKAVDQVSVGDISKRRNTPSPAPRPSKQQKFEKDSTGINSDSHVTNISTGKIYESNEELARQFKKFSNAPKFNLNSEEVYCICRRPDHGGELMVSCDGCEEWFHFKCMHIDEKYSKLIEKFYCKFCYWKGIGETKWKRRCRFHDCFMPIRADIKSKYCSDEHASKFFRDLIFNSRGSNDNRISYIKTIVDYCSKPAHDRSKHELLNKLGHSFPELPEIRNTIDASTQTDLPEKYRNGLENVRIQTDKLISSLEYYKLKTEFLLRIKEKSKLMNEMLQEEQDSRTQEVEGTSNSKKKSKSKTSKKLDLCFYDRSLGNTLNSMQNIEEMKLLVMGQEMESGIDDFNQLKEYYFEHKNDPNKPMIFNSVCIKEKRKCLRHNGWWNLINDEVIKKRNELSETLKKLEDEKSKIIRDYSIELYEKKI